MIQTVRARSDRSVSLAQIDYVHTYSGDQSRRRWPAGPFRGGHVSLTVTL